MKETETLDNVRRAELARAHLARDLAGVVRSGERIVQRGKDVLRKAVPLAIAVVAAGLLVAAAIRPRRRRVFPRRPRSLLAELARKAAFSAVGVLASRLARRLPLPAPGEPAPGEPVPRKARMLGADVDPMLPEPRRARDTTRPGARH